MSVQRLIQDAIPFLILFGLVLLTVWLWRLLKRRKQFAALSHPASQD